ncbi:MAG: DUF4317 family protein [Lachnospiraceae bacterium]|nr:DUF4317 family protein [Lachnospiraceae bacterium]
MTDKETAEIRRHLRTDRTAIKTIYGYYINENKDIVVAFDYPVATMEEVELEQYIARIKKGISGKVGKTLYDVSFATSQVQNGTEYALLKKLRDSKMTNEDARRNLCQGIIDNYETDKGYVILMVYDTYDVITKKNDPAFSGRGSHDGVADTDVFSFILCTICPVQEKAKDICYLTKDRDFSITSENLIVKSPEIGFMFPAFTDRSTDLYGALYYAKNKAAIQENLYVRLFCCDAPLSVSGKVEGFVGVLSELREEGTIDVIKQVSERLQADVEAHREAKIAEPLMLTSEALAGVLDDCGVSEEAAARATNMFKATFGEDGEVPQEILARKTLSITTENMSVSLATEANRSVQFKELGGRRYLLIDVDGEPVFINGVEIKE